MFNVEPGYSRSIGRRALEEYDIVNLSIAVLEGPPALSILLGARYEDIPTLLITKKENSSLYKKLPGLATNILAIEEWGQVSSPKITRELREQNAILVPTTSLIESLEPEIISNLALPFFGNRFITSIEHDWRMRHGILEAASISTPEVYSISSYPQDELVIVKIGDPRHGRIHRVTLGRDVEKILRDLEKKGFSLDNIVIQKYIAGVQVQAHLFYSPVYERIEVLGIDTPLQTNIDSYARAPPIEIWRREPSYVQVANSPIILRDDLLGRIIEYGEKLGRAIQEATGYPPVGTVTIEGVVTPELDYIVFDFDSWATIGVGDYMGSTTPYSALYWAEPMWIGRRIAREVKLAVENNMLEKIIT